MLFALDWDRTITGDPTFWVNFVAHAQARGHRCIIVTRRTARDPVLFSGLSVVYAGDMLKKEAAEEAGYNVDVWIDDEPGTIERCRILHWEDDDPAEQIPPFRAKHHKNRWGTDR